jgi:hypothetical protein
MIRLLRKVGRFGLGPSPEEDGVAETLACDHFNCVKT